MFVLKKDATKKALEDMFKGKKDVLAAFDEKIGDGGSGGGDSSDGGGGWNWNWDDWKSGFEKFWKAFVGCIMSIAKALGAVALFALFVSCRSLLQ